MDNKEVEQLKILIKANADRISDLRQINHPDSIFAQIALCDNNFNKVYERVVELERKFHDFYDSCGIEEITNEQIKSAWISSGLALKEIGAHFGIEIPTASYWVNGNIKNPYQRHTLYMYLKSKASK